MAQKQNLKFKNLDINAGLSQNHVMCILQDSKGFMWVGTRDGLNRYDGYKFTIYKHDPANPESISSNFVTDLKEDANGNIWIATRGGGLNYYNRERDNFTSFQSNRGGYNSLGSDLLKSITIDKSGIVWIGTEDGGVNSYDPAAKQFTRYLHKPEDRQSIGSNVIQCVFADHENNIWWAPMGKDFIYSTGKTSRLAGLKITTRSFAPMISSGTFSKIAGTNSGWEHWVVE